MFKNKKVIVTGGAGFIGSHLVEALVDEGAVVHVIDNLSLGKREKVHLKAEFHHKDIRNPEEIKSLFSSTEYVFHLAAWPRVQYSIENPIETFEINVKGTVNVLEAARRGGVKRLIYSSSAAIYGDQDTMPLVETMPASPKSPYGLHKYEGELWCRLYSDMYDFPTVSLRYFNVYGPGIDPSGSYPLAIANFLKQRSEGKPLTVVGDGTQTRDYIHVRDVVRANLLAATKEQVGKGEVMNIGTGRNISIHEVTRLIGGRVEHTPPRIEPKHSRADNSLSNKLLGWSPSVSFEDGIGELKKIWNIG